MSNPRVKKKLHGTEASRLLCKVVSQTYQANHCRPTPRALDLLRVSYVRWVGLPRNTSKRAKQPNVALFPVLLSEKEQIAFTAVAAPLRARFRSSRRQQRHRSGFLNMKSSPRIDVSRQPAQTLITRRAERLTTVKTTRHLLMLNANHVALITWQAPKTNIMFFVVQRRSRRPPPHQQR